MHPTGKLPDARSGQNDLYTIKKIAERGRVSTRTIRRLIERGELKSHRIGTQIRVSEADWQDYLDGVRQP